MRYRPASARPLRKVSLSTLAGAVMIIVAWLLRRFAGIDVPADVQAALVVLVVSATAYLVPLAHGEVRRR